MVNGQRYHFAPKFPLRVRPTTSARAGAQLSLLGGQLSFFAGTLALSNLFGHMARARLEMPSATRCESV